MKKIVCNFALFDLHQKIAIVETSTGEIEFIASATLEQLPEAMSALSDAKGIHKIHLYGNPVYGKQLSEEILEFSNKNYSWNTLEIEVN